MSRTGKIARLSKVVREELNRRLEDGENGVEVVKWLNGLPETQQVMAAGFAGAPISEQNLTVWRQGGFLEWQARQEALGQIQGLAENAGDVKSAAGGKLSEHLAVTLEARMARILMAWDGKPSEEVEREVKILHVLNRDLAQLRRTDQAADQAALEREVFEAEQQRTHSEVLEYFELWSTHGIVQDWMRKTGDQPMTSAQRDELREIFAYTPVADILRTWDPEEYDPAVGEREEEFDDLDEEDLEADEEDDAVEDAEEDEADGEGEDTDEDQDEEEDEQGAEAPPIKVNQGKSNLICQVYGGQGPVKGKDES